jgi:hypothetical protein
MGEEKRNYIDEVFQNTSLLPQNIASSSTINFSGLLNNYLDYNMDQIHIIKDGRNTTLLFLITFFLVPLPNNIKLSELHLIHHGMQYYAFVMV